jgi:hypothetical protein
MKKEIEANPKEAVLLLAHGTPDVLGEMEQYLKHPASSGCVRGFRALANDVLDRETRESHWREEQCWPV